jgi:hypothetical protein
MWVDVAKVECSVCQVVVGKSDEHRSCVLLALNVFHTEMRGLNHLPLIAGSPSYVETSGWMV